VIFFRYALRSLLARLRANAITLLCISLFVMASSLGLVVYISVKRDIAASAPPENVLVLSKNVVSGFEARSEIDRAIASNVTALPGIRRDGDVVLAAREHVTWITVDNDRRHYQGPTVMRSIDETSFAVHGLKLIEGRMPADGSLEILVHKQLQQLNPHLKIGFEIALPGGKSPIVGVYEGRAGVGGKAGRGTALLTPRSALAQHVKRDVISSITLVAESADRVPELVDSINRNKALDVKAAPTAELLAESAGVSRILGVVVVLTVLLALVAIIAIVTTMNAAVAVRLPELAALLAIGIRRRKLAAMIAVECALLALTGALLGAGAAELLRQHSDALPPGLIPVAGDLSSGAIVPLASICLGTFAGLLGSIAPALTVRRLNIMETLR
jgi:ABC-type antimicrobial peptide transport system permease subunit